MLKRLFRNQFVYNWRYYGLTSVNNPTKLYTFFLNKFKNPRNQLIFCESQMQELFELKDKTKYIACSMVNVDFTELCAVDNYKENYPYTVRLLT